MKNIFNVPDELNKNVKNAPDAILKDYQNAIFEMREEREEKIFTVSKEHELLQCVAAGDTEKLDALCESLKGKIDIGNLSSHVLKQAQYTFVAAITMTTRAAIAGGLSQTEAFALSDTYIQHMDKMVSPYYVNALLSCAIRDFTKRVKDNKNRALSPVILRCKDYITRNLHNKITIADLAKVCRCSQSHLSRIFKSELNVSPHGYIESEKINAAKYLLIHSCYPVHMIADYLNFSNPSNFIVVFKKHTGQTPKVYRKLNIKKKL